MIVGSKIPKQMNEAVLGTVQPSGYGYVIQATDKIQFKWDKLFFAHNKSALPCLVCILNMGLIADRI